MKIQLNISDDPNFYTIMDFMFETDGYQAEDYDRLLVQAEAAGNGFGFAYMSAVQKAADRLQKEWSGCEPEFSSDWLIKTFNEFDNIIRQAVDKALQEYLYAHNGYIDSWPVPFTEIGFELNGKGGQSIRYEFEYFGSDFSVQKVKTEGNKTMTGIGRGRNLKYRSGCILPDMDEDDRSFSEAWHDKWFNICDSIISGFQEPMDYMSW